jgi:hypothetical protein
MEDFANDGVRTIVLKCSAQSAKTETAMALLQWVLCESPGPILWLTADIDAAKDFAKDRFNPAMDLCEPLKGKLPTSRTKRTTLAIYIMGALVKISGAKSTSSLDSTPYRYLFLDEARTYPAGVLQRVDKRTRSFTHNHRKFIFSTPDKEGDELDLAFNGGNQQHWNIAGPFENCKHEQPLTFKLKPDQKGGIGWVANEETLAEDGTPRYDKLLPTVYWECAECGQHMDGASIEAYKPWRKAISRHGIWKAQNLNAPSDYKSYHWNAFVPFWTDWRKAVREYLEALKAAKWGNWEPLKEFYQQTLGMSWSDRMMTLGEEETIMTRQQDYLPEQVEPPAPRTGSNQAYQSLRFMTVDVQAKGGRHFYFVIRQWWRGGASKLIAAGKAWSYEEIREYQTQWKVPAPCVIFDSGYATTEVYSQVLQSGRQWKAYKGEDKDDFLVQGVRSIVKRSDVDPAIGTPMAGRTMIDLFLYAKYGCLDRLAMLMSGQAGDWQFHSSVPDDYAAQLTAYDKLPIENKKTGQVKWIWHRRHKNDHFASCEIMQVAAAAVSGLIYEQEQQGAAQEQTQPARS